MKPLHVDPAVAGLDRSVRFYPALLDAPPTMLEADYAKWMREDPGVSFAITSRGRRKGVDLLGIQVDGGEALREVQARLEAAAAPLQAQGEAVCCYARSEKHWTVDPEGTAWQTFPTTGDSAVYGCDVDLSAVRQR